MKVFVRKGLSKDGKKYLALVVNDVIVTFDTRIIMRVYDIRYSELQEWYDRSDGAITETEIKGE